MASSEFANAAVLRLEHHDRTRTLIKNGLSLLAGKIASFAASYLLVRFVVQAAGPQVYGLWAVCSHLLAYAMILDFGLGLGLQNRFSHAVTRDAQLNLMPLANVATGMMFVIGFMIIILFIALAGFVPESLTWVFGAQATPEQMHIGLQFIGLAVVAMSINLVLQLPVKMAAGIQRHGMPGIAQGLASMGAVLAFPWLMGFGVPLVVGMALVILLPLVVPALVARHELLRVGLEWSCLGGISALVGCSVSGIGKEVRALLLVGMGFFVSQVAAVAVFQTDVIVVSVFWGSLQAASYEVCARLLMIPLLVQGIAMASMWPAVAQGWAQRDYAWVRKAYKRALLVTLFGLIPAVIVAVLSAPWLIPLWTGSHEVTVTSWLAWSYAAFVATSLWAGLHAACLNAIGDIRFAARVAVAQAVMNIVAVLLVVRHGAWAIAAASAFVAITCNAIPLAVRWRWCMKGHIGDVGHG